MASEDIAKEEPDGPQHVLLNNYALIMNQLKTSSTNAYEEIKALLDCQKQADHNKLLRSNLVIPAPNAGLLAYLKG